MDKRLRSGDGERNTLLTRQIAFEACIRFVPLWLVAHGLLFVSRSFRKKLYSSAPAADQCASTRIQPIQVHQGHSGCIHQHGLLIKLIMTTNRADDPSGADSKVRVVFSERCRSGLEASSDPKKFLFHK